MNIYRAAEDLEGAVNQAGLLTSAEDPSFLATHSITADYDAHIETIWSRVAQILDWPDMYYYQNSQATTPTRRVQAHQLRLSQRLAEDTWCQYS